MVGGYIMNYNDIISLIVNDFNRNFNLSSEIIYDSRENIINKNPHFKIGKRVYWTQNVRQHKLGYY